MTTSSPDSRDPIPPPAIAGGDDARGSSPPAFAAVALVLAIAGVVALASRGTPVWTQLRSGPANRAAIVAGIAVLWGVGLAAAGFIASVLHRAVVARSAEAPPLRTTLLRALPGTAVVLTVLSLLAIAAGDPARRGAADGSATAVKRSGRLGELFGIIDWRDSPVRAGPGLPDEDVPGAAAPDESGAGSAVLLLGVAAFAVLVAAAAAMRWSSSRSFSVAPPAGAGGRPPDADRRAVREVLTDTIDAMLADPDPNTAIIGAYARLLEGLDARGAGRRDHEGPMEHLRRVLTVLDVRPEPLRQLIALFELARFSTHPLTATHREQALGALRAVAADLGAAPAAAIARPSPTGVQQ
ncbi:MAG TPA: DUF4129 domain-containing protein [Woeseiaceae bacterium]|nr:DUF4129 domain-containing protein [Woeseiaceae bacterium]